jgi:hypothetical protein
VQAILGLKCIAGHLCDEVVYGSTQIETMLPLHAGVLQTQIDLIHLDFDFTKLASGKGRDPQTDNGSKWP